MSDSKVQVQVQVIKSSLSLRGKILVNKEKVLLVKILVNKEKVFTKFLDMLCKK